MTESALIRLSPAAKAAKTRAHFERKVELIESWAKAGVVDGKGDFPRTLDQLASWSDPERDIHPWRKANIVSDPRYADLRKRYDAAHSALLAKLQQPGRAKEEASKRVLAQQRVVALLEQLVTEQFQHEKTRKQLRRVMQKRHGAMKPASKAASSPKPAK